MDINHIIGISFDIPVWLLIGPGMLYAYYLYMTWKNNIFKKLGIPGPNPTPILGTLPGMFKGGVKGHDQELITQYGDVVGAFMGGEPVMIIADVKMTKEILVKQFNNFVNRTGFNFADNDLASDMLQIVQEKKWKNLRMNLSPMFSSGKLKRMKKHINECLSQLIQNLEPSAKAEMVVDFKDYAGCFTMDTIALTAFGLKINSKTENSTFVDHANKSLASSLKSPILLILLFFRFLIPYMSLLGIHLFPKEGTTFFRHIINQLIEERKNHPISEHDDFIQLMINAQKNHVEEPDPNIKDEHKKRPLTDNEILASCVMFFLTAYETTAHTLCFAVHLLATNPDCQQKLFDEINAVLKGKEPEYADLLELPYLEKVIDETLRIYPQAPRIQRIAKEDVTINNILIPKGMEVNIAVIYLHNCPKFWEHPENFDPERFSPEQKAKRNPYCYLPFGNGPRNCIGMRLALMELKMALIRLLGKYKLKACSETQTNLKQEKVRPSPEGGVYIKLDYR